LLAALASPGGGSGLFGAAVRGLSARLPSLAIALLASALVGCAWTPPQTAALRAAPPLDLRERAELSSVPFIAQTPLHCGPASLAMVLRHIGRDVSAEQLADAVFLPARGGTLQTEMLAGARRHDALSQRVPGRLDALLREVQAGHPVVVLQNLGLAIAPTWHYAVLIGFDRARDELVLRSGLTERQTLSFTTFEHTWARGGHWAMVALSPGELSASADERSTVDAALAFERVAAPASAARVYDALLQRWPADLPAAIGLGHARLKQGDAAGAEAAWQRAAEQHDSAAAWNNLAMLRWQRGDRVGARAALERALRRVSSAEPAFAAAVQATRQTIEGAP
jgi:tetratricopeptide (TPR) repeat protein